MTDFSVDVLGVFEREDPDPILRAVKKLIDEHGDLVLKYVTLSQAKARSAERSKAVLWPVYRCPTLEHKR